LFVASLGNAAQEEPAVAVPDSRAVMTGEQVIQILDETVDWYRTLGMQQQAATQPSDLLILYANRQTADRVMALAFEIARANAELLSSEASAREASNAADSPQSLAKRQAQLDAQRKEIDAEIAAVRTQIVNSPREARGALQERISALQGELDLVSARRNYLDNMARFAYESGANDMGANALKAHIDAIAASVPMASGGSASSGATSASAAATPAPSASGSGSSLSQFGIWDLGGAVLRLSQKANTIEMVEERTARLQELFTEIRTPPLAKLQELTERGEALAARVQASEVNLSGMRDQYDTLAWLFQQTSAIATPLSKAGVLLDQYQSNLENWRETIDRQYRDALKVLAWRLALFAALLGVVLLAAHIWRRAVFHYVHEPRRRSRLLIVQKVVVWLLIVAIVVSTFATEVGSLATFAGLITAGLAVAMQSVLVSIVGYFFLIGRYGVRVGDRVQVGNVSGEVIEMGLVRMHLMELSGQPSLSPTGRVVAFANSIIFQASGGLFKQIPGVNLAWHEITLSLPAKADPAAIKEALLAAVTKVIADYREDINRQAREIQKASSTHARGEPVPQVQLRFAATGVDAVVRYPVQLSLAAEIDERVSRETLAVISNWKEPTN
jgi:small-conductance mechanosensitive channel